MWVIYSSGLIGALILGLSIYFVATVIRLFIELRLDVAMPQEEVARCEQFLEARNYQGLYDFASKCHSFYSRLVAVGIAELPSGLTEAREVMDRNADAETVDMERKISMLAVLGTLGPMIGLVGTLKGMIASFAVIALSDMQLKASEVAGGISEALLLTFEGVAPERAGDLFLCRVQEPRRQDLRRYAAWPPTSLVRRISRKSAKIATTESCRAGCPRRFLPELKERAPCPPRSRTAPAPSRI